MKTRFIILLLLYATNSFCQLSEQHFGDVNTRALQFKDSLQEKGIDTFLVYSKGCNGCIVGLDTTYYFFWKDKKVTYFTRISTASLETEIVRSKDAFQYYNNNLEAIEGEVFEDTDLWVDHYMYYSILIRYGNHLYAREIPEHYIFSNKNKYAVNLYCRITYVLNNIYI